MMPTQVSSPTYIIGEDVSDRQGRDGFWTKMATALSVTQLMIGISCVAFHVAAFYIDKSINQPLHYIGEGLLTGAVIIIAGVFGLASSKKKTNCTIITFLVLSVLAGLFALFPLVFGILGATMMFGETESLMMPISQLVLATVEIIVATWSIGVSSQAICCPNSELAASASRMMGGAGLTQFMATREGQHVVIFTHGSHQPAVLYNGAHGPYIVQHAGMTGVSLPPSALYRVASQETGPAIRAGYHFTLQQHHVSTDDGPAVIVGAQSVTVSEVTPGTEAAQEEENTSIAEEDVEKQNLLESEAKDKKADGEQAETRVPIVPVIKVDPPSLVEQPVHEAGFETEDEEARLLGE